MGMFGFLKKKQDEVPSAPATPGNSPMPAMDLPEIKLDGMDQPPSADAYAPPYGAQQPPQQKPRPPQPMKPSMEDVQPDYDSMGGIQPPEQANLQESLQQLPNEDTFSDSLFPNEEDMLQKPEDTGPDGPAESLDSFAPDTEENVDLPAAPEKLGKPMVRDFSQLANEQPKIKPEETEEQAEIEPIEPQDFGDENPEPSMDIEETLPGAPHEPEDQYEPEQPEGRFEPEQPESQFEPEQTVEDQFKEAIEPEKASEVFDEDVYSAEPAPHLTNSDRRVVNQALFINVDHFRNIADIINGLSDDAKGAEETLFRIKDVVLGREKVFDKWQNDIEQVERELIQLDKLLFNV